MWDRNMGASPGSRDPAPSLIPTAQTHISASQTQPKGDTDALQVRKAPKPELGNVPDCHRTDPLPSCLRDHMASRGILWVQMSVAAGIPV